MIRNGIIFEGELYVPDDTTSSSGRTKCEVCDHDPKLCFHACNVFEAHHLRCLGDVTEIKTSDYLVGELSRKEEEVLVGKRLMEGYGGWTRSFGVIKEIVVEKSYMFLFEDTKETCSLNDDLFHQLVREGQTLPAYAYGDKTSREGVKLWLEEG